MPRDERDREDLLSEAKALVERVSLAIGGHADPVVVGFRRDHSASFYLSPRRVYQFTSAGQLRRAFVNDLLYKADNRHLVALRRERKEQAVELVRHVLDPPAREAFLAEMRSHLHDLLHALSKGKFQAIGQVPENVDLIPRIRCWLDEFADSGAIAHSPRAC